MIPRKKRRTVRPSRKLDHQRRSVTKTFFQIFVFRFYFLKQVFFQKSVRFAKKLPKNKKEKKGKDSRKRIRPRIEIEYEHEPVHQKKKAVH